MAGSGLSWFRATLILNIPYKKGDSWRDCFNAYDLALMQAPDDSNEQKAIQATIEGELLGETITREPESRDEGRVLKTNKNKLGEEITHNMIRAAGFYPNSDLDGDWIIEKVYRAKEFNGWLNLNKINPSLHIMAWYEAMGIEGATTGRGSNAPKPITPLTGNHQIQMYPIVPIANYDKWLKADLWTIERAILLLINAESLPSHSYYSFGGCKTEDEQAVYDEFTSVLDIVKASLDAGTLKKIGKGIYTLTTQVLPGDFIQWAESKGYQIPDELKAIGTATQTEVVGDVGAVDDTQDSLKTYERYKNSLDALKIDLTCLKVQDIFNQVKLTDKKLWSIKFTTFQRDVWPIYSEANNLKKQPGRPRSK